MSIKVIVSCLAVLTLSYALANQDSRQGYSPRNDEERQRNQTQEDIKKAINRAEEERKFRSINFGDPCELNPNLPVCPAEK